MTILFTQNRASLHLFSKKITQCNQIIPLKIYVMHEFHSKCVFFFIQCVSCLYGSNQWQCSLSGSSWICWHLFHIMRCYVLRMMKMKTSSNVSRLFSIIFLDFFARFSKQNHKKAFRINDTWELIQMNCIAAQIHNSSERQRSVGHPLHRNTQMNTFI